MSAPPIKVMIIDDEPPIRKLLRMGLSTQGYEILEASNGKIALDLLKQEPASSFWIWGFLTFRATNCCA